MYFVSSISLSLVTLVRTKEHLFSLLTVCRASTNTAICSNARLPVGTFNQQFVRRGHISGGARKRTQTAKPSSCIPKKKASKTWIKDVILLPSPRISMVPKGLARETLYDDGFVISGFKLSSTATESEISLEIERELAEKFAKIKSPSKFHFVRAVEKKIVRVINNQEINGEVLKHVCGPRGDKPIFISATEDMTDMLSNQSAFENDLANEGNEQNEALDANLNIALDDLDGISDSELLYPYNMMENTDSTTSPLRSNQETAANCKVDTQQPSGAAREDDHQVTVTCPICQEGFPSESIEMHASSCSPKPAGGLSTDKEQFDCLAEERRQRLRHVDLCSLVSLSSLLFAAAIFLQMC